MKKSKSVNTQRIILYVDNELCTYRTLLTDKKYSTHSTTNDFNNARK